MPHNQYPQPQPTTTTWNATPSHNILCFPGPTTNQPIFSMMPLHHATTPATYRLILHPHDPEQHKKHLTLLGISAVSIQELREIALRLATRALWQADCVFPNRATADLVYDGFEIQERWHDGQMRRLYALRIEMDAASARNKHQVERCEKRIAFIQHDLQISGWQVEDERRICAAGDKYERDLMDQKYRDYTGVLEMKDLILQYRDDQKMKKGIYDTHRQKIWRGIEKRWRDYIESLPLGKTALVQYRQTMG